MADGGQPEGRKPVDGAGVVSRHGAKALRLIGVGIVLVLGAVIAFVVVVVAGPPSIEDLRSRAGLDERRELVIGVKNDQPGIAEFRDRQWTGFDIDIAYLIAEDLGFKRSDVRFVAIESEDRARRQATDTNARRVGVDLVIASYSITADREAAEGVAFSAPYLYTEQSVVTRADHRPVSSLADLRGLPVCTLATATSETALAHAGATVHNPKSISECFAALDRREVDAVSTDAAILGGYKSRFPKKYRHFDIGLEAVEAWGVNVGENVALRDLVNLSLYRSREDPKDTRWEEAFDRHLRPSVAINLPTPIAVEQQPEVKDVPEVRQWPWERIEP